MMCAKKKFVLKYQVLKSLKNLYATKIEDVK